MPRKNKADFALIVTDEAGAFVEIPCPSFSQAKRSGDYKKIAKAVSKKAKRAGVSKKDKDLEHLSEFATHFVESFAPHWIRLHIAEHANPNYIDFLREDLDAVLFAHYALNEYMHAYAKSWGVDVDHDANPFNSDLFSLEMNGATASNALEALLRPLFDSMVKLSEMFRQMTDEDAQNEKEARAMSVIKDMGLMDAH